MEFLCNKPWKKCLRRNWWNSKKIADKGQFTAPLHNPILTTEAIMEFCTANIPGIHFVNVPPEEIAKHVLKLSGQFQAAKMVKGTQQFHRLNHRSDPPELVSVQNSEDDMIVT